MNYLNQKHELTNNGFSILDNIYSNKEVKSILACIDNTEKKESSFLISKDLFAIRQLLKNIPELKNLLFNENLKGLLNTLFQEKSFLTKAIYFDKPKNSNWFVAYHQDLSISVKKKVEMEGFKNWTNKKGQLGVQPPLEILNNTITVRLHLDDTDSKNGALKVIPSSHKNGVVRFNADILINENICTVNEGGVMLMKPLIFHASSRTTNGKRRRVIHLEFNSKELEVPLQWLEKEE